MAAAPTPAGTVITNQAKVDFVNGGLSFTEWSNIDSFVVEALSAVSSDFRISIRSSTIAAGVGETVMFIVRVENNDVELSNGAVLLRLPPELSFVDVVPASGSISSFVPTTSDGHLLNFDIGTLANGGVVEFAYYAKVVAGSENGFATTKGSALEVLSGRYSRQALNTLLIQQEFFVDASFVAGRVMTGGCTGPNAGLANARIYLEDGTVATTDALGRYHIEGTKPGLHVVHLDKTSLPAGVEPVQCDANTRNGGAADTQFIDTQGGALWRADFVLSGTAAARQAAVAPLPSVEQPTWGDDKLSKFLETAPARLDIVAPAEGFYPSIGSVTVVVTHKPDEKVELTLDGNPVSPLNFDGMVFNAAKTLAASRWKGVDLHDGGNLLEAVTVAKNGAKGERTGRVVEFSGPATDGTFDPSLSTLVADGATVPVIALKLMAEGNRPARPGTFVDIDIEAPHRRLELVSAQDPLSQKAPSRFMVGPGGVALIRLAPTVKSGEVRLRAKLGGETRLFRAWLTPSISAPLLVALAEGTLGQNSISGNAAGGANAQDLFADGRVAFFVKSTILGDWMIKAGYDSAKSGKDAQGRLFKEIEPKRYFPIYGDASRTEYEADSSGPLFVHLERQGFAVQYGDFDTGLATARLSRYERRMHGLQTNYRGDDFGVSAFVSNTSNKFVKDEIKGNGTSGLYRMTSKPIIINSERVMIEERDRFRNGEVVSTKSLMRHIDYEIDYDRGTLFFKEPVQSQSTSLNPLIIVAEYETNGAQSKQLTYGGRAAAYAFGGNFELGVTAIHQGNSSGGANLYGVDATATIAPGTVVKAEYARSRDGPAGPGEAGAYSVEVKHDSKAFSGRLYAHSQDKTFGLDQQNAGQAGTREVGFEGRARLDDVAKGLGVEAKAYQRESDQIAGKRQFAEFLISWTSEDVEMKLGARRVKDGTGDATDQVLASALYRVTDRLSVLVTEEFSLGGRKTNSDHPNRTILGADYRITDNFSFVATHEIIDSESDHGSITRAGFEGSFWSGGRFKTAAQRDLADTSERLFANIGLSQDFQIEDGWSISASVDRQQRVYETGEDNGGLGGAGDRESFTAISIGTAVDTNIGKITARVESRLGSDERMNVAIGHYLSPYASLSFASTFRYLFEDPDTGEDRTTAALLLGMAYRPSDGPLILQRLDLIFNSNPADDAGSQSWKIVDNTLINFEPTDDLELSLLLGLKYAVDKTGPVRYAAFTTMTGLEGRYDITDKIDIGVRGSTLANWKAGTFAYSFGPSIGYSLSEAIWVSAGYNIAGYTDDDFSAAGYTTQGFFTQFRARLDSSDAEEAAKWFTAQ